MTKPRAAASAPPPAEQTNTSPADAAPPPAADAAAAAEAAPTGMTAAQAAAAVKRTITLSDGGVTRTRKVPLAESEVLAFRDYGTHVVVVTTDGQKFSSAEA